MPIRFVGSKHTCSLSQAIIATKFLFVEFVGPNKQTVDMRTLASDGRKVSAAHENTTCLHTIGAHCCIWWPFDAFVEIPHSTAMNSNLCSRCWVVEHKSLCWRWSFIRPDGRSTPKQGARIMCFRCSMNFNLDGIGVSTQRSRVLQQIRRHCQTRDQTKIPLLRCRRQTAILWNHKFESPIFIVIYVAAMLL